MISFGTDYITLITGEYFLRRINDDENFLTSPMYEFNGNNIYGIFPVNNKEHKVCSNGEKCFGGVINIESYNNIYYELKKNKIDLTHVINKNELLGKYMKEKYKYENIGIPFIAKIGYNARKLNKYIESSSPVWNCYVRVGLIYSTSEMIKDRSIAMKTLSESAVPRFPEYISDFANDIDILFRDWIWKEFSDVDETKSLQQRMIALDRYYRSGLDKVHFTKK